MVTGRPLRALAGLALAILLWLGWRLPAMQADVQRLAQLLAPPAPVLMVQVPSLLRAAKRERPRQPAQIGSPPASGESKTARSASGWGWVAVPRPNPAAMQRPVATIPPPIPLAPPPTLPTILPTQPPPVTAQSSAYSLADAAYARLNAGQRRQAAALFDAALALQPDNRQWHADRRALSRRWQAGGFALVRDGGPLPNQPGSGLPGAAASPVLGGGQVGGSLAFLPDPYASRPLAIVARVNMAADPARLRPDTAQAAIGLRQTLLHGVTLSAERLIPLGNATRGNWTLRLAAGGRSGRIEAYGEAGVLGSGDAYAGGQASARLLRLGPATLSAATWASVRGHRPVGHRIMAGHPRRSRLAAARGRQRRAGQRPGAHRVGGILGSVRP
jgi:hypothetical protein